METITYCRDAGRIKDNVHKIPGIEQGSKRNLFFQAHLNPHILGQLTWPLVLILQSGHHLHDVLEIVRWGEEHVSI